MSVLVHNLEHGFNILWYDQTVIDDSEAVTQLRAIADSYASLDDRRDPTKALIVAPWSRADGGAFPEVAGYAFTHWYADPADRTRSRDDEVGLTQYCADVSADLVRSWMTAYPCETPRRASGT